MFSKIGKSILSLEEKIVTQGPINLLEEKIKFFNNYYDYNPQFEFIEKPLFVDFESCLEIVEEIKNDDVRELYYKKIDEYKLKYQMINQIGKSSKEFTKLSSEMYGEQTEETVKSAYKIIENMPKINFSKRDRRFFRFKAIRKEINRHLRKNKFKGKLIVRKNRAILNNVSVSKISGNLNISINYIADKDEVNDIIYHEIETHMRRFENGKKTGYGIMRIGTKGYLKYEEGLATLTGHAHKKNNNLWHPALLAIGTDIASKSDFVSVFREINSIIKNPFRSWSYAVRVKRGISDTSQPGVFMNDLYLQWLADCGRELIRRPELIKVAYNGKASYEELEKFAPYGRENIPLTDEDIKIIFKNNYIEYE